MTLRRVIIGRRFSIVRAPAVVLAVGAVAALASRTAHADLRVVEEPIDGGGQRTVYHMTVTPAAEPVPAFHYSLTIPEFERKPGNAAPFYYRAILDSPGVFKDLREKYGDAFDEWYSFDLPLAELPLDKVRDAVGAFEPRVMTNLREASRRRQCDWSWHLENLPGPQAIGFLIPELQETRALCRMLGLRPASDCRRTARRRRRGAAHGISTQS